MSEDLNVSIKTRQKVERTYEEVFCWNYTDQEWITYDEPFVLISYYVYIDSSKLNYLALKFPHAITFFSKYYPHLDFTNTVLIWPRDGWSRRWNQFFVANRATSAQLQALQPVTIFILVWERIKILPYAQ